MAEVDVLVDTLGTRPDLALLEQPIVARGVERSFQIISEAVTRFRNAGMELSDCEPSIDWKGWRAFGNAIRHEYDRLDSGTIQDTLVDELVPLRAAALRLKARFEAEASS